MGRWLILSVVIGALFACSKTEPPAVDSAPVAEAPRTAPDTDSAAEKSPAPTNQEPIGAPGSIEVIVRFEGKAPAPARLDLSTDPYCAKLTITDPSATVNNDDTLRNVVVRLEDVRGDYEPNPQRQVIINQKDCLFVPRVQVAMRGEKLGVTNDDPTLHNVHAFKGARYESWFNIAQPQGAAIITKKLNIEDRTRIRCDVHPWMSAYVFVASHPFQAVTGAEGPVTLEDVPSRGKPYRLSTWHERFGTKEAMVRVEAGKTQKIVVIYSASDETD